MRWSADLADWRPCAVFRCWPMVGSRAESGVGWMVQVPGTGRTDACSSGSPTAVCFDGSKERNKLFVQAQCSSSLKTMDDSSRNGFAVCRNMAVSLVPSLGVA